jgi:hypothetical protein
MVTTISTAPVGQRGGVSTLASSSQHSAGGNLTTAPHHSGWNSGGYLGHHSWRGYPPHGQNPYWGFHQGYPELYPYGYQALGFPIGPGYQRFPGSNYGNSDPKASVSAVKTQGSTGHPIPPQNLFGMTESTSMDVDQSSPGLTCSHIILMRESGSSLLMKFSPQ